jgi:hypothetical protein
MFDLCIHLVERQSSGVQPLTSSWIARGQACADASRRSTGADFFDCEVAHAARTARIQLRVADFDRHRGAVKKAAG